MKEGKFQLANTEPLSYSKAGVDRLARKKSREMIGGALRKEWKGYSQGKPLILPFGALFPASGQHEYYYDLEIEGVGTKTLFAELEPDGYSTIGVDGVAMVVNDVIRSGAAPLLLADAVHISKSTPSRLESLLSGVRRGARLSGCTLASGESGDVEEILHERLVGSKAEPFDLIVSCLGIAGEKQIIRGHVEEGDCIIGLESSGIHSNGISLARKILLKTWGGKYEADEVPDGMSRQVIKELLEPTRIYVREIIEARKKFALKAAVHITGDGFGKFHRLIDFQRRAKRQLGIEFDEIRPSSNIFDLIERTSKEIRKPISKEEMFRTFNMGYGFAVVVGPESVEELIDLFNRYHPARRIGRLTNSGKIVIRRRDDLQKPLVL